MCYLLTVLFLVGLVAVALKDWQTVRWIELVFGDGLSADEAMLQIANQSEVDGTTEVAEATDTESEEVAQAEESTDGEEE